MSERVETDLDYYRRKQLPDYLDQVAKVLYLGGALLFIGGLWIDWQEPGRVLVQAFVFTDEPYANSGLFVGAILLLFVGYLLSVAADRIDAFQRAEPEDQTQEWVVDIGTEHE